VGVKTGYGTDDLKLADLVVKDMAQGFAEIEKFIGV